MYSIENSREPMDRGHSEFVLSVVSAGFGEFVVALRLSQWMSQLGARQFFFVGEIEAQRGH
jgi:hypothetical protein